MKLLIVFWPKLPENTNVSLPLSAPLSVLPGSLLSGLANALGVAAEVAPLVIIVLGAPFPAVTVDPASGVTAATVAVPLGAVNTVCGSTTS